MPGKKQRKEKCVREKEEGDESAALIQWKISSKIGSDKKRDAAHTNEIKMLPHRKGK